jgi:hypothetical protein
VGSTSCRSSAWTWNSGADWRPPARATALDIPATPLYARASLPIQLEDTAVFFLRVGGGLKLIDMAFFRFYLEVSADFPYAGSGVSFFGSQAVNAGLGVWFKF